MLPEAKCYRLIFWPGYFMVGVEPGRIKSGRLYSTVYHLLFSYKIDNSDKNTIVYICQSSHSSQLPSNERFIFGLVLSDNNL